MSLPVTETAGQVTFAVRVMPRAQPEGVAGVRDGRLVVRVAAAPVDGRANEAVCKILAGALKVPKSAVVIQAGHAARTKRIAVPAACRERLLALAKE